MMTIKRALLGLSVLVFFSNFGFVAPAVSDMDLLKEDIIKILPQNVNFLDKVWECLEESDNLKDEKNKKTFLSYLAFFVKALFGNDEDLPDGASFEGRLRIMASTFATYYTVPFKCTPALVDEMERVMNGVAEPLEAEGKALILAEDPVKFLSRYIKPLVEKFELLCKQCSDFGDIQAMERYQLWKLALGFIFHCWFLEVHKNLVKSLKK